MPDFGAIMEDAVLAELSPLPYQRVRPMRWVCAVEGPFHRLFYYQALKGATYSPVWGLSLNFVPCGWHKKLAWKRTLKSAVCDVLIDPIDDPSFPSGWSTFSHIEGYKPARPLQVVQAAAIAARTARKDMDRITTLDDVVAWFETRAKMPSRRFTLENYNQAHLAWGLALIALGRGEEGEMHLEKWCSSHGIRREHPLLHKAEGEALRPAAARLT